MNSNTKIVRYSPYASISNNQQSMPFSTPPVLIKNKTLSKNNFKDRALLNRFTFFLHFIFNLIIILSFAFLISSFFYIIREEFRVKVHNERQRLKMFRDESAFKYRINRCELEIPYMKLKCLEWKKNSENEEIQVGKLFVDSIGEMMDTFVQRISWKAFVLLGVMVISYMFIHRNIR